MFTAKILKENNYHVNLVTISTPYELSLLSLEYRYNELKKLGIPARYTKKESHDEAYKNIKNTVLELSNSNLFDRFYVYSRTLNSFKENIFEASQKDEILEVFEKGRIRLVEDKEKNNSNFIYEKIFIPPVK